MKIALVFRNLLRSSIERIAEAWNGVNASVLWPAPAISYMSFAEKINYRRIFSGFESLVNVSRLER